MKPIKFKGQNKELGKPDSMTDEECGSLPVFNNGIQSISCWQCESFIERIKFLLTGKMWLGVYFGLTQPPVYLSVHKPLEKAK